MLFIEAVKLFSPQMDNTVDNFFNEIDQIAPPKECSKGGCDWQECFDSSSGFSYYWNVKTDQVTWEAPTEFKLWKQENPNHNATNQKPAVAPLFPSTLSSTKIYKLQDDVTNITNNRQESSTTAKSTRNDRVVLIPSYGDGSDSETEESNEEVKANVVKPHPSPKKLKENSKQPSKNNSEDDDIDLLTKLQKRAKILKDLGGELPPDVKKIVEQNGSFTKKESQHKVKSEGFSLVAGYGESDDEDEATRKTSDASSPPATEIDSGCSTLFSTLKPIDVKQFLESKKETETEPIETKVFHRKRRIGIDFNLDKSKTDTSPAEGERQGLGFKSETDNKSSAQDKTKINYPGFQSGGLIFVKSDVLNPVNEVEERETESDVNKAETLKKIEETHKTLNEKLTFLSEGRDPVSPVQIIIIQMETLYEAMKAGSLTVTYLHKWLKETCSELVKLEKDAAPNGWLLQWDRYDMFDLIHTRFI
uniref:WW domain-containing protein n=2 Tax=Photinus pyralis TaxID=7054 RepID=A0A1Y1LTC9_PHOPY